jgi:hypothetical protein
MVSGQIDVIEGGVGEGEGSWVLENPHAAMINPAAQSAHEASTSSLERKCRQRLSHARCSQVQLDWDFGV